MAIGDTVKTRSDRSIVGALRSLNAVTSTGAGASFNLGGPYNDFTVQLVGTVTTAATVQLHGALVSSGEAGSTSVWQQIGSNVTWDSTVGPALVRVSPAANTTALVSAVWVRMVCTSFTTSASTATESLSGWIAAQ